MKWFEQAKPISALAPMADLTDAPFCRIVKENCPRESGDSPVVIFREMISSAALTRGNAKTLAMAEISDFERPIILQIFGSDPTTMAEAARILEEKFRPDGIDINMGCPAKKIVSNFDGSSLMRQPEKATAIIQAVKAAVRLPVSVKTRLGWSRSDEILEFAKTIEAAGADLISVHGRTKDQGYSGAADWEMVGRAKKTVTIPLLLNGDVVDGASAARALKISSADGVMIGRGALGNPWVFREIASAVCDVGACATHPGRMACAPTLAERIDVVLRHARYQIERYGDKGLVNLRKHLPFYFKRELKAEYPKIDFMQLRSALVKVTTLEELEGLLWKLRST